MPKTNVLQFPDKIRQRFIPLPTNAPANATFDLYEIKENIFGFAVGDSLIVEMNFNPSDITPDTVCIVDTGEDLRPMVNVDKEKDSIIGIVYTFIRQVKI